MRVSFSKHEVYVLFFSRSVRSDPEGRYYRISTRLQQFSSLTAGIAALVLLIIASVRVWQPGWASVACMATSWYMVNYNYYMSVWIASGTFARVAGASVAEKCAFFSRRRVCAGLCTELRVAVLLQAGRVKLVPDR